MKNPIIPIAVLAAGFLLISSNKKKSVATTTTQPKDQPKNNPPVEDNVGKGKTYTYKCGSLEITSIDAFTDELDSKVAKYISSNKIDKDNVFLLDPVKFSKEFIGSLNPNCVKQPSNMTENEKALYLMITILALDTFEQLFALKDYSEDKYSNVIGSRCPPHPENEPGDVSKCKYIFEEFDPGYTSWKQHLEKSIFALQTYLGLVGKNEQLKKIGEQIKSTGQYP